LTDYIEIILPKHCNVTINLIIIIKLFFMFKLGEHSRSPARKDTFIRLRIRSEYQKAYRNRMG